MEELVAKLAMILEVEKLDLAKKFTDYDEFDSLAALTILATLDSDYGKAMRVAALRNYASLEAFCQDVLA